MDTTVGYNEIVVPVADQIEVQHGDVFAIGWNTGTIKMAGVDCSATRTYNEWTPLSGAWTVGQYKTLTQRNDCRRYSARGLISSDGPSKLLKYKLKKMLVLCTLFFT